VQKPERLYCDCIVYCFIVGSCLCLVSRPYIIYFIILWHDVVCLCWKCRQTQKKTNLKQEDKNALVTHCAYQRRDEQGKLTCVCLVACPGFFGAMAHLYLYVSTARPARGHACTYHNVLLISGNETRWGMGSTYGTVGANISATPHGNH